MSTGNDRRKIETDPSAGRPGAPSDPRRRPVLETEYHRRFTDPVPDGKTPREVHALDRANRLRVIALSGAGGLLGFVLGMFVAMLFRGAPLAWAYPFLLGGAGWLLVLLVVSLITGGAGGLFSNIYMPGGRPGPRREYSLAESLAARGRYEDAVSAFELAVAEHPDDPVPHLRIARICRDHLGDVERAVRWFKRVRDVPSLPEAQWRVATRELIELYDRSGEAPRAAPELARLAERFPDSEEGGWARQRLAEVKRVIAEERSLQ